ncbi:MAG: hypothetical protein AB1505_28510 [Candidatus Latescibacterota bacterium]
MPAFLAANYLGFQTPDLGPLYLFLGAVAGLLVFLYVARALGRVRERRIERRSAWETFGKIARARGLTPEQTRVLAQLARASKVGRPSQIIASVRLFDRCLDRVQSRDGLQDRQLRLLQEARERLLTTSSSQDRRKERRNLERLECSLPLGLVLVARDDLEQDVTTQELTDVERVRAKLGELAAEAQAEQGQVGDIGAGGVEVVVREDIPAEEGDYVGLRTAAGQTLPVDLGGLWTRVCSVEHCAEEGVTRLHLAFLPYDAEKKREIIRLVYQKQEGAAATEGAQAAPRPRPKRRPPRPQAPGVGSAPAEPPVSAP